VRGIAAAGVHSHAVTQSGIVFSWGHLLLYGPGDARRPMIAEGFDGVRVRRVCAGEGKTFAIGEEEEVLSWGRGTYGKLGHGNTQDQPSPKRIEALLGVRVSQVVVDAYHTLALAEDGQVYAWGENWHRALLGNPLVGGELLPRPVEALRGVRVGRIAAACTRSYAVADTGELWAWGRDSGGHPPLGHGERVDCPLPVQIESLRGINVDAVFAGPTHSLAVADDGSMYVWGKPNTLWQGGALGLGLNAFATSHAEAEELVRTPRRIPGLRVECGP
jgi:E3 ubiquitin-protein ligase HERC2